MLTVIVIVIRSMAPNFAAALFAVSFVTLQTSAQTAQSYFPRLIVYEPTGTESGKSNIILTLLGDADKNGVGWRLTLDRPSLQLENGFAEVDSKEMNEEYNQNHKLKANTPPILRVYINTAEPVPQPSGSRQKNPEEPPSSTAPASEAQFTTNSELSTTTTTSRPQSMLPDVPSKSIGEEGGGGREKAVEPLSGSTSREDEDDDFFHGDFSSTDIRPGLEHKSNVECGTIAVEQPSPLITFGQATYEGEFPWHAALYHTKAVALTYICGGSLISRRHVITAGHCVTRRRSDVTLKPENLVIYLGKHYLKRWSNPGIQNYEVARIIKHPNFDPDTFAHGIAVIKLASSVAYTDYVRPICLWEGAQDLKSVIGKYGTVVGWGFDETGVLTEVLREVKMPVVSQETCIFSYPDFFARFTTSETYCAGFRNGTTVCNGDSGGGMVFLKETKVPNKRAWQLRGIVTISVALRNEFRCDPSHYVVFTDVAKYLDFIKVAISM